MDITKVLLAKTADEARELAIKWQNWISEQNLSYSEFAEWQAVFEELAKKWPELREEFTENGII